MSEPFDYDSLNPGIRNVVRLLHVWGYLTCDSGDGVTREHECDRDHAYVVVPVPDGWPLRDFADELALWLDVFCGISIGPIGHGEPSIQISYDPWCRTAYLDLMDLDDATLARAKEAL